MLGGSLPVLTRCWIMFQCDYAKASVFLTNKLVHLDDSNKKYEVFVGQFGANHLIEKKYFLKNCRRFLEKTRKMKNSFNKEEHLEKYGYEQWHELTEIQKTFHSPCGPCYGCELMQQSDDIIEVRNYMHV